LAKKSIENGQEKNQKFAVKILVKSGKMKPSKTKKCPKIVLYGGFWAFLRAFTVWKQ
jgi:hypothetical protein